MMLLPFFVATAVDALRAARCHALLRYITPSLRLRLRSTPFDIAATLFIFAAITISSHYFAMPHMLSFFQPPTPIFVSMPLRLFAAADTRHMPHAVYGCQRYAR